MRRAEIERQNEYQLRRVADFVPQADLLAPARYAMLYERSVGRLRSALDLPSVNEGKGINRVVDDATRKLSGAIERG